MTARDALELATRGGARVLGRDDIGSLSPGMAADFICVNVDRPAFAGALADPVAALVLCDVGQVDYSFINGRRVVDAGRLTTAELPSLIATVNRLSAALVQA
jgi:cytosine/adenosine deaminase-related metal-dependent hydrolase